METRSMADPSVLLHPKFLVQLERGMVSFQNSLAPGSSTGLLCQVTAPLCLPGESSAASWQHWGAAAELRPPLAVRPALLLLKCYPRRRGFQCWAALAPGPTSPPRSAPAQRGGAPGPRWLSRSAAPADSSHGGVRAPTLGPGRTILPRLA